MTSSRWWSAANTSALIRLWWVNRASGQPVMSPAAAAISRLWILAPAATRTSTTSVMPNTAAWSSAVPLGTPPESGAETASMSAPASISALATSASPQLAAVTSGVSLSPGRPSTGAPASVSALTAAPVPGSSEGSPSRSWLNCSMAM